MISIPSIRVVLASGSAYRATQLRRILDWFEIEPAEIDETPIPGEAPRALSRRLAENKARALGPRPKRLIIGSDQVAALDDQPVGKPLEHEVAIQQLLSFSGREVVFYTSVVLLAAADDREPAVHTDETRVHFRHIDRELAERYVARDKPLDCAGAFKAEEAGPILIERIDTSDPSAIIGLPLLWLAGALMAEGIRLPA